jgi:hypothetical protein
MDDILIYSKDPAKHAEHLEQVLALLQDNKMNCKLSKCSFGQTETKFLGHIVSKDGISVDPTKIKVVALFRTVRLCPLLAKSCEVRS